MIQTYKVVGFLAREHGTNGVKHMIESDRYDPVYIFTHRRYPASEDPHKAQREDYPEIQSLCDTHNVPLCSIDSKKEALTIDDVLHSVGEFDFMASISWRRLIPENQLAMPGIGGINLHRGRLPAYKGAEPIKQALHNNDIAITITSHLLSEEIDSGETIAIYEHPVNFDTDCSLNENISRLKRELTPHFGPLLIRALNHMADRYESR